ncbi:LPS-assembly lipoprotein LptE [Pseudomonas sp. Marseille-QA0892]
MMKRTLLVIGAALFLTACGFHLRGTGVDRISLTELDVQARDSYGATVKDLREMLEDAGVRVHNGAPYTLYIADERDTSRTASYSGGSRSAENQLTKTLDYQVRGTGGLPLMSNRLEVQRVYVYDGNNPIGYEQESVKLSQEMRRDLLQQLMLRLQSLDAAQLEKMQQVAEEKRRQEQEALRRAQEEANRPQQSPIEFPTRSQ